MSAAAAAARALTERLQLKPTQANTAGAFEPEGHAVLLLLGCRTVQQLLQSLVVDLPDTILIAQARHTL